MTVTFEPNPSIVRPYVIYNVKKKINLSLSFSLGLTFSEWQPFKDILGRYC